MLLSDLNHCFMGILLLVTVVMACVMYAYYVNSKRPDHDPKKKDYHPVAILLAPVTFPFLIIVSVSLFILRVITYGVFMVLFIFALIFIRKPFILEWLKKKAMTIGNLLLEANTVLIRLFLGPRPGSRGSA